MQLKQLIQDIAEYTVKNEIVECAMGGLSLYEINFKENNNYPLLFISPSTNHTISNNTITYQIVIYYIDRLLRDNDNNIDIVNASVSKLQQIINIIKSFDNVLKLNSDYQITNFADTQRLADNVAGGYVNLSITVQNTQGVCAIDAVLPTLKVVLQNKNVEITENGEYNITFDNGYTGLKEVNVDVNIDTQSYYQEGYNEGFSKGETEGYNTGYREGDVNGREEQKSLLESITITENGVYDNENGYDEITVEVDTSGAYNEGFDKGKAEGKEEGKAEQKALIQPITITENGIYSNENGYSPIDVSIDTDSYFNEGYNEGFSKGESEGYNEGYDVGVVNGKEQQKSLLESIKIVNNGVYDNENGYDEITVEIDTQSYYNEGFSKGKTEGIEQGKEEQKSLLESITITENGVYDNENGYDVVDVEIDTQSYYDNGYSTGYSEGVVNGVEQGKAEQKALIQPITITENGTYTNENGYSPIDVKLDVDSYYNNGYNTGYNEGENVGYNNGYNEGFDNGKVEGVEQGKEEQKSLLTSITINENGTYTNENGYDEVIVDVPTGGGDTSKLKLPNGISLKDSTFSTIDMNEQDWSNVYDWGEMFSNCTNLTDIQNFPTDVEILSTSYMFNGCQNLTSIPALDTSNVTNMSYMFNGCQNLTSIPQINTSNVLNMSYMFNGCQNLTSIPQIDTSNVTNMSGMFYACFNLTSIPALDTSNVTNMSNMFNFCQNLTSILALDTSNVTNMSNMFYNCVNLEEVKFKGNPQKLTNVSNMFILASSRIETPKMYYPQEFETNYQKIINVLPSKWTAVPY